MSQSSPNWPTDQDRQYTAAPPLPVADAAVDVRFDYMKRMYGYLMAGIASFVALEIFLFTVGLGDAIARFAISTNWLLILGAFMLANWLATTYLFKAKTRTGQLAAYGLIILAQALIFTPMLWLAFNQIGGSVVGQAAAVSTVAFVGLTGVAMTSSKDFSFLGSLLKWGGIVAIALIVLSVIFGMTLGVWFSIAMIAFAGGAILWEPQQILRNYPEGTELVAAVQLFSSVMLLFWYVLRLFMSRD